MPLRALLDGRDVIAPYLDAHAWAAVKARRLALTMPCCASRAIPRVSSRGLRHFAHQHLHAQGVACDWKPETDEHRRAKIEILAACRTAGWEAQPEARAEDEAWRADVLAWHFTSTGSKKSIAFEVQLSPQPLEETEARQSRYAAANVRGCWFIQPRRSTAERWDRDEHFRKPVADLPAFRIHFAADGAPFVAIPTDHAEERDHIEPLQEFVHALLSRRVRFATPTRNTVAQRVRVIFVPIDCWKCRTPGHFYDLDTQHHDADDLGDPAHDRTACGRPLRSEWTPYALRQDVIRAVRTHLRAHPNDQIRLGAIKPRYRKEYDCKELSFGCPECDAIYGPKFLSKMVSAHLKNGVLASFPFVDLDLPPSGQRSPDPHWCYPTNGPFCDRLTSADAGK
jgi:hypothetical protein